MACGHKAGGRTRDFCRNRHELSKAHLTQALENPELLPPQPPLQAIPPGPGAAPGPGFPPTPTPAPPFRFSRGRPIAWLQNSGNREGRWGLAPTPGSPRFSLQSRAKPCPEGRPLPKGWHQLAWKKVAPADRKVREERRTWPGARGQRAKAAGCASPASRRPGSAPGRGGAGGAGGCSPGPPRLAGVSASTSLTAPASRSRSGRRSWPSLGRGRLHGRRPSSRRRRAASPAATTAVAATWAPRGPERARRLRAAAPPPPAAARAVDSTSASAGGRGGGAAARPGHSHRRAGPGPPRAARDPAQSQDPAQTPDPAQPHDPTRLPDPAQSRDPVYPAPCAQPGTPRRPWTRLWASFGVIGGSAC
nr:uncharacterized protein LOC116156375 [Camelus dromedarius]